MKLKVKKLFGDRLVYRRTKMSESTKFAIYCFGCGFVSAFCIILYLLIG